MEQFRYGTNSLGPAFSEDHFRTGQDVFRVFYEPEAAQSSVTRPEMFSVHCQYGGGLPQTAAMY